MSGLGLRQSDGWNQGGSRPRGFGTSTALRSTLDWSHQHYNDGRGVVAHQESHKGSPTKDGMGFAPHSQSPTDPNRKNNVSLLNLGIE